MSWINTFLGEFAGSHLMLGLLVLMMFVILIFMARVSKVVFTGVMFVGVYALAEAGIIPMWVFGILLIIVGIYLGKMFINSFFNNR